MIGVEIVEEAVEAAKKNAAENGLSNCMFLAGDVLKVLNEIEEKPDVIVLDPPETASIRRQSERSSATAWRISFISPVNPPAWQGIWRLFCRAATGWSGFDAWTCFRGHIMWRLLYFCHTNPRTVLLM